MEVDQFNVSLSIEVAAKLSISGDVYIYENNNQ